MKKLFFLTAILFFSSLSCATEPCPNGGIQSKKISSVCCKDGFRYNSYYKDYTDIDFKACGQPQERWIPTDGSYRYPRVWGCPRGFEYNKNYNVCCQNGYRLNEDGTPLIWIDACGCPEGTKDGGADICCIQNKPGFALTNEELWGPIVETYQPSRCGCPDDGKLVGDPLGISPGVVCCKYGLAFSEKWGKYVKWMPRCILNLF